MRPNSAALRQEELVSREPVDFQEAVETIRALRRDLRDACSTPTSIIIRCPGCGRLHSRGWMCPTDGCEAGE